MSARKRNTASRSRTRGRREGPDTTSGFL